MRKTGIYQKLGGLDYFIPYPLPPKDPPLNLDPQILSLYGEARQALAQLDEMSKRLPSMQRFIKAYVIKEALLSSAIEGIHTTLLNVFTTALGNTKPNKETQLVVNYTEALQAALSLMRNDNLPLCSRIINKAHEILLSYGEGDASSPGHYRKQSVQVGPLVPPPAPEIPHLMSALEKYIHEPSQLPPLIQSGLVHVIFETIHPFLNGNGRIGRLIIVLMLIESGLINAPIVYPSYYFKKRHSQYYTMLNRVRTDGDFEGWITYYLTVIRDSARDAYQRAQDIELLEKNLRLQIQRDAQFSKMRETADAILTYLFDQPIARITDISQATEKAYNTVANILTLFQSLQLVSEHTVNKRSKEYRFDPYITLLEKEYNQ